MHIYDISNVRIRNMISSQKDIIELSNKLVMLDENVPINPNIEEMQIKDVDFSNISEDFNRFEMSSL